MNQLHIVINDLPPMPRNRSHMVARNMLIKTDLAREFEKDLKLRMNDYAEMFFTFRHEFKPTQSYLKVKYTIFTPKSELFTKEGKISLKAVDVDAHKLFQDVMFKSLGLDDKYIRNVSIFTPVSIDDKWNYVITIEKVDIEHLFL
jgi:hypothetical protein